MTINQLSLQQPFITKDGSTIRSILDRTNAGLSLISAFTLKSDHAVNQSE